MYRILSLTGGGFLGYYTAAVLAELEEKTQHCVADVTDFYAGTSIGGILSLALAAGKTPKELRKAFLDNRKTIFAKPGWQYFGAKYKQEGLRDTIYEILGKGIVDSPLSSLPKPVMVTTVGLDTAKGVLLSSLDPETRHWRVIDAALATSAAPTYFPAHTVEGIRYIDGGLAANMPDMAALYHAMKYKSKALQDIRMLSVGTTYSASHVAPYKSLKDNSGALKWAKKLVPFFMDAQRNLIIQQCEQAFYHNCYKRLDTEIDKHLELDDISAKTVIKMDEAAQACINKNSNSASVVTYLGLDGAQELN